MLKSLQIKNFQSHKNTELEFDPGVNVIIGPSDSGKSSIIRALKWAIWNRPLGDSFRSHWGGDTSATITTDDCRVTRFKGKGGDHYLLEFPDHDKKAIEFKAFGTSAPEEINHALGFNELNVQNQHSSAFLLSDNPGEVSRHFNKVAKIDQIDLSLQLIERWVRSYSQTVVKETSDLERYEKQLEDFLYLNKMEIDIEVLEKMEQYCLTWKNKVRRVDKILLDLKDVERDISISSSILQMEGDLLIILQQKEERSKEIKRYKKLRELVESALEIDQEMTSLGMLISDETRVNDIITDQKMLDQKNWEAQKFEAFQDSLEAIENELAVHNNQLKTWEEEWHILMPDVCPLCGK